jgi:hypothetical protein
MHDIRIAIILLPLLPLFVLTAYTRASDQSAMQCIHSIPACHYHQRKQTPPNIQRQETERRECNRPYNGEDTKTSLGIKVLVGMFEKTIPSNASRNPSLLDMYC